MCNASEIQYSFFIEKIGLGPLFTKSLLIDLVGQGYTYIIWGCSTVQPCFTVEKSSLLLYILGPFINLHSLSIVNLWAGPNDITYGYGLENSALAPSPNPFRKLVDFRVAIREVPEVTVQYTLPKTNIFAPKNGWFPIGISFSRGLFSGAMLVSGTV